MTTTVAIAKLCSGIARYGITNGWGSSQVFYNVKPTWSVQNTNKVFVESQTGNHKIQESGRQSVPNSDANFTCKWFIRCIRIPTAHNATTTSKMRAQPVPSQIQKNKTKTRKCFLIPRIVEKHCTTYDTTRHVGDPTEATTMASMIKIIQYSVFLISQ